MLVIGLTGGIASGKTTVAKIFSNFNLEIIDVDKIAKEIIHPQKDTWKKIIEAFGEKILDKNLAIDRSKLAKIIFNTSKKRKILNNITHPVILTKIKERLIELKSKDIVVLDIPLLFEAGFEDIVDKIIVVYVDEEVQLERLRRRSKLSIKEAKDRIKSQMSLLEKSKKADWILCNNGKVEELEDKVKMLFEEIEKETLKKIKLHE
ncbi:MAG: dephospho-CoA kinase [bacterium]|nr:dephospho-CoA kinase [bacterium]